MGKEDKDYQSTRMSPAFLRGVRIGVAAVKAGRVTPWEDVEREIFGHDAARSGAKGH